MEVIVGYVRVSSDLLEEDDPRMGVRGVRRHAEPLGDNDPPRLGETAGGWGGYPYTEGFGF